MEKKEILRRLEVLYYVHVYEQGHNIPRTLVINTNIFKEINSYTFMLMDVYHSDILREDQIFMFDKQLPYLYSYNFESRRLSDIAINSVRKSCGLAPL